MALVKKRWPNKKKKAGTQVWYGRSAEDLPYKKLGALEHDVFSSYSGPDVGLSIVTQLDAANANMQNGITDESPAKKPALDIAGCKAWNIKNRKAYGICMSLYDQHPINGKISGDPIADSFGVCARKNNAILIVADGVNWGEKSKLAARCAVFGCMKHMNEHMFTEEGKVIKNTHEIFRLLLTSLDTAHNTILAYEGGLTTLCVAIVVPLRDNKQYVVCIVNVGDSLAYVFSKRHGVREITTGSHDIRSERDIRDAGGALGPVNGKDPELHNLTCSMTFCDPGDIVYLTTDGISDNFDPVVTKIAVAKKFENETVDKDGNENHTLPSTTNTGSPSTTRIPNTTECGVKDGKPEMEPHERHQYAVKEMERIIHEFELFTEMPCSAQEVCGALLQHVLKLTDPKRKILEDPELYGKKLRSKDRKRRDSEIVAKMSRAPGKLDHASIVGYEVGVYQGNEDENYEMETEGEDSSIMGSQASINTEGTMDSQQIHNRWWNTESGLSPTYILPAESGLNVSSPVTEDTFRILKKDATKKDGAKSPQQPRQEPVMTPASEAGLDEPSKPAPEPEVEKQPSDDEILEGEEEEEDDDEEFDFIDADDDSFSEEEEVVTEEEVEVKEAEDDGRCTPTNTNDPESTPKLSPKVTPKVKTRKKHKQKSPSPKEVEETPEVKFEKFKKAKTGGLPASLWLSGNPGLSRDVGSSFHTWSAPDGKPKWNPKLLKKSPVKKQEEERESQEREIRSSEEREPSKKMESQEREIQEQEPKAEEKEIKEEAEIETEAEEKEVEPESKTEYIEDDSRTEDDIDDEESSLEKSTEEKAREEEEGEAMVLDEEPKARVVTPDTIDECEEEEQEQEVKEKAETGDETDAQPVENNQKGESPSNIGVSEENEKEGFELVEKTESMNELADIKPPENDQATRVGDSKPEENDIEVDLPGFKLDHFSASPEGEKGSDHGDDGTDGINENKKRESWVELASGSSAEELDIVSEPVPQDADAIQVYPPEEIIIVDTEVPGRDQNEIIAVAVREEPQEDFQPCVELTEHGAVFVGSKSSSQESDEDTSDRTDKDNADGSELKQDHKTIIDVGHYMINPDLKSDADNTVTAAESELTEQSQSLPTQDDLPPSSEQPDSDHTLQPSTEDGVTNRTDIKSSAASQEKESMKQSEDPSHPDNGHEC